MPNRFTCVLCGTSLICRSDFVQHMLTHTGEGRFQCDICGRIYSQNLHLTRHMRAHTGDRSFQCDRCGSSFRHRSYLNQHIRTHTGDRSFQCDRCGSSFRHRSCLNQHMRFFHPTSGIYGVQATTHTQHSESLHGIANTVSTINSSLGTATVTTVRSTTSPLVMTAVSQASGTFTVIDPSVDLKRDYDNECPICFDSLNDGETIATPCCKAKYHIACLSKLDQLSSIGFFCPNCRGALTRDWLSKTPER